MDVDDTRSGFTLLEYSENNTELSQSFPRSDVSLKYFGNWKKCLKVFFVPNMAEPVGRELDCYPPPRPIESSFAKASAAALNVR